MRAGAAGGSVALAKLRNTRTEGKNSFGNVSVQSVCVFALEYMFCVDANIERAFSGLGRWT